MSQLFASNSGLKPAASAYNGGSAEYHVDVKFPKTNGKVDYAAAIQIMDTMARNPNGNQIEFSNAAVAGKRWNPNASPEQKLALIKSAMEAHSHSHYGHQESVDFYLIPPGAKDRFDPKVSQPRDMPLALAAGWKAEYGKDDRYGNYVAVLDEKGQLMYKMGHGGTNHALPSNFVASAAMASGQTATPEVQLAENTSPATGAKTSLFQQMSNKDANGKPTSLTQMYDEQAKSDPTNVGFLEMITLVILLLAGLDNKAPKTEDYARNPNAGREALVKLDEERQNGGLNPPEVKTTRAAQPQDTNVVITPNVPDVRGKSNHASHSHS